jgi:hypothetical protein
MVAEPVVVRAVRCGGGGAIALEVAVTPRHYGLGVVDGVERGVRVRLRGAPAIEGFRGRRGGGL